MTITIKKYDSNNKQIWNDFVENSKNGIFMFNRDFMEYHSDRFVENSLMFYQDDELLALLPANIKNNVLYSHGGLTYGGFITNASMKQKKMLDCFAELRLYLQQNGIEKLVYKKVPYIFYNNPADEDLYALFVNNAKILKIEPSTTVDFQAPCKMPKGRKAQISRAKREGVLIEESLEFDKFIELENSVLSDKHNTKAVHTADELKRLYSSFPNNIKLYVAKYNGEIIASTLIFIYDEVVHTQYMSANEKAREIGALDCLIKNLMDKYSETKRYFDFGISTEDGGRYLNQGLISQKEGFGGRAVVYETYTMSV